MPADSPTDSSTQEVKTAVKTTKGAASSAKGAVQAANTAKTVIQVAAAGAESTNPVGWAMLAMKLKPYLDKLKRLQRKIMLGIGALVGYLIFLFGLKILGLLAGLVFGAITGLPLLFIPVAGPFLYAGWVGFWGYKGWTNPMGTFNTISHTVTLPQTAYHYVVSAIKSIASIPGAITSAISGALSSIGSAIATGAAAIWNGATSAVGGIFGGLAKGVSFLGEGLSSAGTFVASAKFVTIPVAGAIGATTITSVLTGINTNSSFFNPGIDNPYQIVGDNEFFTIYKTADPIRLQNENLPIEITYTINLTAKETPITITGIGDFIQVRGQNGIFNLTTDVNGNSFASPCSNSPPGNMNPGQTWTCQIKILAENSATINFDDSHVINVVSATADPDGPAAPLSSFATSTVDIGDPPSTAPPPTGGSPPPSVGGPGCPSGWPITGVITQGPDGASSHGDNSPTPGNEAFDIGAPIGTPVYATLSGTINYSVDESGSSTSPSNNQSLGITPASPCIHASTGNPLSYVYYFHLSSRCNPTTCFLTNGQVVNKGDMIGRSGQAGSGPHLHYQFDETATRSVGGRQFPLETPYIPVNVRRDCNSAAECNTATQAP